MGVTQLKWILSNDHIAKRSVGESIQCSAEPPRSDNGEIGANHLNTLAVSIRFDGIIRNGLGMSFAIRPLSTAFGCTRRTRR
jgi:hypothetical protein